MFASEIAFNYAGWNVNLRGKYTGQRYYTYTNDQGFGGYTSFDADAGYDFGQAGVLQGLKLSLNVTNLTDKRLRLQPHRLRQQRPEWPPAGVPRQRPATGVLDLGCQVLSWRSGNRDWGFVTASLVAAYGFSMLIWTLLVLEWLTRRSEWLSGGRGRCGVSGMYASYIPHRPSAALA